jgi:hypothetical protein
MGLRAVDQWIHTNCHMTIQSHSAIALGVAIHGYPEHTEISGPWALAARIAVILDGLSLTAPP